MICQPMCVNCVHYHRMHPLFNSYRHVSYCAVESEAYPQARVCDQFIEFSERFEHVAELLRSSEVG